MTNNSGFGLVVRFTAKGKKEAEEFEDAAKGMLEKMQGHHKEKGTLVYSIHSVPGEPLVRVFYELYKNRAAHKSHLDTDHFRELKTKYIESGTHLKEFGGCIITSLGMVEHQGLPKIPSS
jgi:quinol monooxygenase YgiN